MDDELRRLLRDQDGVVSRAQALRLGEQPHDVRRRLRRREWAEVVPGVYVDHTGRPSWQQRAMAGVLHAGRLDDHGRPVGAALGGHAALRAATGARWRRAVDASPIEVCIHLRRTVAQVRDYRFVRTAGLDDRTDWLRTPPRLRPEEALLDLAVRADDLLDAVALLADGLQAGCATVGQVRSALGARERVRGRAALAEALDDVALGTCSVLEREFLRRVVRAHGLPVPRLQSPRTDAAGQRQRRDAKWEAVGLVVELDGRLFHDHAVQRDRDLERDLADVVSGRVVVRLGWGQVTRRACTSADALTVLLRRGGWVGGVRRCADCP